MLKGVNMILLSDIKAEKFIEFRTKYGSNCNDDGDDIMMLIDFYVDKHEVQEDEN